MKKTKSTHNFTHQPPLTSITFNFDDTVNFNEYPFSLNLIKRLKTINFDTKVTFFIGENGTGKSTILEAIANNAGFGSEGGSKNIQFQTAENKFHSGIQNLAACTTLSWNIKKPNNGYFFRADSFFNVANYLDTITSEAGWAYGSYGGKSLHEQSHGEGFFSFFTNRLGNEGFFIFDEPEAALSPQRQLSLMIIINEMCKKPDVQFIIATHSPILLAYPGATIYSCDSEELKKIDYKDTEHYQVTKQFLDNPELYLHHLFEKK